MQILAFAVGLLLMADPREPVAIRQALQLIPRARLLASTDFKDPEDFKELKDLGYWPPWVVQDMDGDGRPDIVAVITRQVPAGQQYGVIAVHAATPHRVH